MTLGKPNSNHIRVLSTIKDQAAQAAQDEVDRMQAESKLPQGPLVLEIDWCDVEVSSKIGVGGFSRVFQVTSDEIDGGDKKQLALKCLNAKTMDDKKLFEDGAVDLAAEGEILSRLGEHPNVVQLHAITKGGPKQAFQGDDPRGYFLVIDLLSGGTLKSKLEVYRNASGKKFGSLVSASSSSLMLYKCSESTMISRLKSIGLGVAQGLSHLHDRNVCLRDLKPDNVGFDENGTPKIFDLGFAREFHTLQEGEIAGSFRYMAPEVGLGKGSQLASDVYSFGVLLYEMLTLKKPFARVSKSRDDFIEHVYRKEYRPSTSTIPSKAIRDLIKACWQPDPTRRPLIQEVIRILRVEIALADAIAKPSSFGSRGGGGLLSSSSNHNKSSTGRLAMSMLNLSFSSRNKSSESLSNGHHTRNASWSKLRKRSQNGTTSSSSDSLASAGGTTPSSKANATWPKMISRKSSDNLGSRSSASSLYQKFSRNDGTSSDSLASITGSSTTKSNSSWSKMISRTRGDKLNLSNHRSSVNNNASSWSTKTQSSTRMLTNSRTSLLVGGRSGELSSHASLCSISDMDLSAVSNPDPTVSTERKNATWKQYPTAASGGTATRGPPNPFLANWSKSSPQLDFYVDGGSEE